MKTTPTLGLKLYDGTDAPDLVSGYNASMDTLDGSRILCFKRSFDGTEDLNDLKNTGYYNDASSVIPANAAPGLTRPGCYIVLDTCRGTATGQCTTQIAVGTPRRGKDNVLVRTYHATTGWTEWLPVSAEQGALPANGAAGQVLVKSSASDYDCEWMNPTALDNVLSLDSTYGLQQGGTLAPALQVRLPNSTKSGGLEPTGLTIRAADYSTSYTLGTGRGELTNIGKINGRAPVGMSNYVILSGSHAAGADYAELVAAGVNVVKLGAGGIYLAAATVSLKGVATVNNIPATAGIACATTDNIEVTVNVVAPIPAQQTVVNVPIRFQVSKTAPTIVTVGKNDGDYTLLPCAVTPLSYPS